MAYWLIWAARSASGGNGGSILRAALDQSSFEFRPFGLTGGGAAAASALYLIRDGRREALPSKVTNVMLRKGDIVRLETSGGGGFGEPKMRLAEQVERDVRLGYVSPEAAASCYGQRRAGTAG